jgi:hypothetical protein
MPGSEEEVEIRAATVVGVERLRTALKRRIEADVEGCAAATEAAADGGGSVEVGESGPGPVVPNAVQLDWWLWTQGERQRATHPTPHHCLTIFY